jgi:hypothetical protein
MNRSLTCGADISTRVKLSWFTGMMGFATKTRLQYDLGRAGHVYSCMIDKHTLQVRLMSLIHMLSNIQLYSEPHALFLLTCALLTMFPVGQDIDPQL